MKTGKLPDRPIRILLCCAAICLIVAALLLLLRNRRGAPVFAEFSESDVLDGSRDCYLNALTVLDRYAEKEERGATSQLLLVTYADKADQPIVLSLLIREGDPLYARLTPYWTEQQTDDLQTFSGYFFTSRLSRLGADAEQAFRFDAEAFAKWYAEPVVSREIVLTYAGETEQEYSEAVAEKTMWMQIAAIVLATFGVMLSVIALIRGAANRRRLNG